MAEMAKEVSHGRVDTRGFRHSHSVYEKRLEATMTDIVTYCDVNTCEECPRYGDDCDGDKRVEHTDLISRADAIELAVDVETPEGTYESAIYVDDLMALPSAEAVPQLKQTDTLIIADALRYLAKDTERYLTDRTRADVLRQHFLKYGASMCKGGEE